LSAIDSAGTNDSTCPRRVMPAPSLIGIDWGSTNARAMLLASDGTLLAHQDHALGIKVVPAGGHRDSFKRMTGAWRHEFGPLPTFLSGMIGSRHGWLEAPYLPCPADLKTLGRQLVPGPDEPAVFIVPGLKMNGARPDVMRGEELQLLGLSTQPSSPELVCIPGTHSKWIAIQNAEVRDFFTSMTGEMFDAVLGHTLFAQLTPKHSETAFRRPAFETGVALSVAPHNFLHALFELRAALLLGHIATADLPDMISGLLIGTELRHIQSVGTSDKRVALLAAPALAERYACALRMFSFEPVLYSVQDVTARGFFALFQSSRFAA
jgi:2-dehydro-3-deoxygalactonokinase